MGIPVVHITALKYLHDRVNDACAGIPNLQFNLLVDILGVTMDVKIYAVAVAERLVLYVCNTHAHAADECGNKVILILAVCHLAVNIDHHGTEQCCAALEVGRFNTPVGSICLQVHVHSKRHWNGVVSAHVESELTLAGRCRSVYSECYLLVAE